MQEHPQNGPVIGSLIVIAVLVVGGLYVYGGKLAAEKSQTAAPASTIINLPTEYLATTTATSTTDFSTSTGQ